MKGLDWRNQEDMFSLEQKWTPFSLTKEQSNAVAAFLLKLGVDWGRLDFMWTGSKLVFLEYNANGEFVFLDLKNQFGLLDYELGTLIGVNSGKGEGEVITNWHVVNGSTLVAVVFKPALEGMKPGPDDMKLGRVVKYDEVADLVFSDSRLAKSLLTRSRLRIGPRP